MGRDATRAPSLELPLDPGSGEPLHRQIAAQLRRAVLERRLAPGTPLPSSRLLARELGCARGTVLAAFEELAAEGYVAAVPGSGTAVAADLPDDALAAAAPAARAGRRPTTAPPAPRLSRRAEAELAMPPRPSDAHGPRPEAFALGRPAVDAFPFALWARLLEAEWRRPPRDAAVPVHPFGHPGLRRAIAAHLGASRGFALDPAEVVVTSGIRQSIGLLARLLLDPGEPAWVEEPGFAGTRAALEAAGARVVPVPVDAAGVPPERVAALAAGARLGVVTPAHHYPLGAVLPLARRLALLAWAERAGGWIAEDDYDGEYRYAGRPLAPLRALDHPGAGRVAYLGSFSKLLFPTLRLSYLVLPPALVDPAARLLAAAGPAEASLLGQGALARFLAEGHFAAHLRRTRRLYAERQEALVAAARRHLAGLLEVPPDPGGMHLVGSPAGAGGLDDRVATAAAARAGVTVVPLSAGYFGPPTARGLLLGYAAVAPEGIEAAVLRLRAALDSRACDAGE